MHSPAHRYRVEQAYTVSPAEARQGRYGIPLGLGLFAFIMYFGFIREYGEADRGIVDFLNRDISHVVPQTAKLKKIQEQVEQEKKMQPDRKL